MFPGMDAKKMQAAMKQMGISQEEINSNRVVIECEGENIVIENPSVTKVKMQGQETWQISGEETVEVASKFSEEDVKLVMEKSGKSEDVARETLEKAGGDLTEAIMELS